MRNSTSAAGSGSLAGALACALAASAGGALIGIYRNAMETDGQRAQIAQAIGRALRPRRLRPRPADHRRQAHQGMRLPDAGGRPRPRNRGDGAPAQRHAEGAAHKAFLAVNLRAGAPAPATSSPSTRCSARPSCARSSPTAASSTCASRRTSTRSRGSTGRTSCGCAPSTSPAAPTRAAAASSPSSAGELVADVTDDGAGELAGPRIGLLASARRRRPRARSASFDDVVVRVPNPF